MSNVPLYLNLAFKDANPLQQLSKVAFDKRSEGQYMTIYSWTLSNGSDWDRIGLSNFGVTWRHNLKIDVPFGNVYDYYSGVWKYQTSPQKKAQTKRSKNYREFLVEVGSRFIGFANLALCFPMSACDFWMKYNKNKAKKMSRKEYGLNYFPLKNHACF